jgi:hypothetical protein
MPNVGRLSSPFTFIMQLGKLSAVITVEGVPVSEYAVEYSVDGLEATCWIASQNDKVFDFF